MGNNPGGEEAPGKNSFLCQANRQDRKVKSKRNTKLSSTEMFADYEEMVAQGLERQKKMNNEANDQLRDTYMAKLGVQSLNSTAGSTAETDGFPMRMAAKERPRQSTTSTEETKSLQGTAINTNGAKNEKIQLDMASPKEVKRTTVIFNENQQNTKNAKARHSEAIGNLQGYFYQKQVTQKRMSTTAQALNNLNDDEIRTPKAETNQTLIQPPQYTSFTEVKGKPQTDSMNEETKQNLSQSGFEENDLFTHLTYLSQLSNDVQKHQQVDQEGPGEYKIKLIDSSAASPASKTSLRNQSATPKQRGMTTPDYNTPTPPVKQQSSESKEVGQGEKRMSRFQSHLKRASSNLNLLDEGVPAHRNSSPSSKFNPLLLDQEKQQSGGKLRLQRQVSMDVNSVRGLGSTPGDKSNLRSSSRSNQQIRTQFMSKLTYGGIWLRPQDKPKVHQTCIIFDWDDTILCTTFLAPHQHLIYEPNLRFPPTLQKRLTELDDVAFELLAKSKKYGRVYIVTNAAEGWVQLSAHRFLPKVFQEIQTDVTIISARAHYEKLYPRNYQKWKVQAFLETKQDMEDDAITNLIALGDNIFEIEAAYILGNTFKSAFIKTVKFRQSPSTSELIKQIKLVLTQFDLICNSPKNLTVRLLKQTRAEDQAQARESTTASANVARRTSVPHGDTGTATSTAIMANLNQRNS